MSDTFEGYRAFRRLRTRMEKIPADEIIKINVDIPKTIAIVLAAERKINEYQERMAKLPELTMGGDIRQIAMATLYVHTETQKQDTLITDLVAEGTALRSDLLMSAKVLARRGLMDGTKLKSLRGGRGHVDLANDLMRLAEIYRARWKEVRRKVAVTMEDVKRSAKLGTLILSALGGKAVGIDVREDEVDMRDMRRRAFTLLVQTYDVIRRAITFLRWNEGDADKIAPSLYMSRKIGPSQRAPELADKTETTAANIAEPMDETEATAANLARPMADLARPMADLARPMAGIARPKADIATPTAGIARVTGTDVEAPMAPVVSDGEEAPFGPPAYDPRPPAEILPFSFGPTADVGVETRFGVLEDVPSAPENGAAGSAVPGST